MTDEELSISDATLIARLRAANAYKGPDFNTPIADPIKVAAADRIEALVKERDATVALLAQSGDGIRLIARIERLEAALRHAERVMVDPDCEPGNSITNAIQIARAALKGDGHE